MELNFSKGDEIILKDNCSQIFEGIVQGINKELGRILLSNVIQRPGTKEIEGCRLFDITEILEISPKNSTLVKQKVQNEASVNVKPSELKYCDPYKLKKEYVYIEDFSSNFYLAVELLKQSNVIGFCLEDRSKGRSERASVLALSTSSKVFIFDIKNLGDEAFSKGLREVLESPEIVKIVHDCRLQSDCLKHKYLVNLENVRDVEAEDIMIVYQDRKMIRRHSRSLDYLVKVYMNVEIDIINASFKKWDERPLCSDLLESLACFVSYLIPLQNHIEKKYLQRLIDASDMYNKFVRDSDLFEFVQTDNKITLREKMIELVKCQVDPRFDPLNSQKSKKV